MQHMAKTSESEIRKLLAANLSRFIAEAGLSESKLALLIGASQASVNRWCKGEVA
jgi:predicted transcriptional regulator